MDTTKLVPLAITGLALWAAFYWGNHIVKGMALGAGGFILANQIPVVNAGLNAKLLTAAA